MSLTAAIRWDPDLERFLIIIKTDDPELADVIIAASTVYEVVDGLGALGIPLRDAEVLGDPNPELRHGDAS